MRMHDVWSWYVHGAAAHTRDLSLLALGSAPWLYAGLLVSLTLGVLLSAAIIRDLVLSPSYDSAPRAILTPQ